MGKKSKKRAKAVEPAVEPEVKYVEVHDSPIISAVDNVLDAVYDWYDALADEDGVSVAELSPEEVRLVVFYEKFLQLSHGNCEHDHNDNDPMPDPDDPNVLESGIDAFDSYLRKRR